MFLKKTQQGHFWAIIVCDMPNAPKFAQSPVLTASVLYLFVKHIEGEICYRI